MKKFFILATMAALTVWSCGKTDDPTPKPDPDPTPSGKAPVANFTYATDGLTVTFTNSSTDATSYLWNFGDGTTSTETSPVHSYSAADDYKVTLTAANDAGDQNKKEVTISVAGAPKAYFSTTSIKDRAGKFGKIIELDATSSENAVSIAWDFGDGETLANGTQFTVQHEFPAFEETYKVKATVTSSAGEQNTYEADVTVVGYNELIKGGSMEQEDAQYWTVKEYWMMAEDWSGEVDVPQFVHEWGCTVGGPKGGKGGYLRIGGESQFMQYSFMSTVYQAIEVVEGDRIELSAKVNWGADTVENGLWWWCIGDNAETLGNDHSGSVVLELFNYWGIDPDPVIPPLPPLPAWDGDLAGVGLPDDAGYGVSADNEANVEVTEDGKLIYIAPFTGTAYVGFQLRSVWSNFWGEGKDYGVDEISAKIIL